MLVEALTASAGLSGEPIRYRDLSDLAGHWVEDPEFDRILAEQDQTPYTRDAHFEHLPQLARI